MALEDRSRRVDPAALRLLWEQVADDIRADIASGYVTRGDRLPGELELASQYGVSRVTVRRAIQELTGEGLVMVMRGRGTYIR